MNLSRRLAKLEGKFGPVSATRTYDLRQLHPAEVDFICQFKFRPPDDQEFLDNLPAINALLRQCEVEPMKSRRVILPRFPDRLQVYWRHQRFVNEGFELPRGNYEFRNLTFAEQEQFQMLCRQYGWVPEADEVEIKPLSLWLEDDLSDLCILLDYTIPQSEKAIHQRRDA